MPTRRRKVMEKRAKDSIGVSAVRWFRMRITKALLLFEPAFEYPFLSIVVTIATAGIPSVVVLFLSIIMVAVLFLEGAVFQITKEIRKLRGLEVEDWEEDWFV
jgi:hypothetical protein